MYHYNIHFRAKNHEFCGGQNKKNSKDYLLWINDRKGNEFLYTIGCVNNKTGIITLKTPAVYPMKLQPQVDRLIKLIKSIWKD